MSRTLATVWAVVVLLIAGLVMAQIPIGGGGGGGGAGTVTNSGNFTTNAAIVGANNGTQIKTANVNTTIDPATGNIATPGTLSSGVGGGTSGQVCFNGATSGQACISVQGPAGTPTPIQLPTANGTVGNFLQLSGTAGGAQQTTWAASTGTTCDPFVLTNSCLFWDMASATGVGTNGSPIVAGSGLWSFLSGTPTITALAAGASTIPAGWQISSNGAANNEVDFLLGPSVGTASAKFVPTSFWASAATFDLKWTLQLNTFGGVAGDNEAFFFGCSDSGLTLTNAVGIEYVSGTDTQWTARTSNAGTATKTNIAAGDTSRHNLEVKKTTTANSIQFCVDATCQTQTTNIPTVGLNCGVYFKGTTTTTVTMNAFKGTLAMTGLTNP